jgi:hypothetical protein
MNRHAEKPVREPEDDESGETILVEVHACPLCGDMAMRRQTAEYGLGEA